MFYHRVLPPPSAVPAHCLAAALVTGRDSLTLHRIMTTEEPTDAADKDSSTPPSNKTSPSLSLPGDHSPQSPDQERYDESTKIGTPTHSRRKRASSQLQTRVIPTEQSLPPIPTSILQSEDSLSQVCLCQRDPKVPRPRNGMPFYCVL